MGVFLVTPGGVQDDGDETWVDGVQARALACSRAIPDCAPGGAGKPCVVFGTKPA